MWAVTTVSPVAAKTAASAWLPKRWHRANGTCELLGKHLKILSVEKLKVLRAQIKH